MILLCSSLGFRNVALIVLLLKVRNMGVTLDTRFQLSSILPQKCILKLFTSLHHPVEAAITSYLDVTVSFQYLSFSSNPPPMHSQRGICTSLLPLRLSCYTKSTAFHLALRSQVLLPAFLGDKGPPASYLPSIPEAGTVVPHRRSVSVGCTTDQMLAPKSKVLALVS